MKRILILVILHIVIIGCASVSSPIGGIKDEQHPVLVKSNPKDQSINFKGKEVILVFDEWMKKEAIEKQLIITPRSKIDYDYKLKKEEFRIIFNEPLKDSTTYTLNFREGLKDITEDNVWENPRLSFSTGNFLDSMKIQGNVKSLMTEQVLKNYTVGLYDPTIDTSNLRQGEPIYFTTTDEKGNYLIQNIKAGKYLLYGFLDSNDNLINESSTEPFTYHPKILELQAAPQSIDLLSVKVNQDTLALKSAVSNGKDFVIKYNKGIKDYHITNLNDSASFIYSNLIDDGKTIQIYIENFLMNTEEWNELDSVGLLVNVQDSTFNNLKDTIYAKFRNSNIVNDDIKVKTTSETTISGTDQIFTLYLNKPVQYINYDSILLKYGEHIITEFSRKDIKFNSHKNIIKLNFKLSEKQLDSISTKVTNDLSAKNNDSINNIPTDSLTKIPADTLLNTDSTINIKDKKQKDKSIKNNLQRSVTQGTTDSNREANSTQQGQNVGRDLHLYFGKSTLIGIEKDSSATSNYKLQYKALANYGTISGKIIGSADNYVIELLKENFTVVDTIRNTKTYLFEWVPAGKYRIRVLIDSNNNGQWDAGNPMIMTASEKVIHFNEVITVKANWEIIDKNIDIDAFLKEETAEKTVDN